MSHENNNYPIQYIEPIQLDNGTIVQLRPVHPNDSKHAENLNQIVSEDSLYQRFLGFVRISDAVVKRLTQLDYEREMAIVAEIKQASQKQIIGIARIASNEEKKADFAILIADAWHGSGLGKAMTEYILAIAKDLGYDSVEAQVFSNNIAMLKILRQKNFVLQEQDAMITNAKLIFAEKAPSSSSKIVSNSYQSLIKELQKQ